MTASGSRILVVHVVTVPESLRFLAGQAAYMRARGIDLEIISSPGEALERFGHAEGVPVHAVPMPRRISPVADLRSLWTLVPLLRRLRPTIVHAHTPKGGLLGTIAAWVARVPVRIYHIRGLPYMTASGTRRALLQTTERISCRLAHMVLCVSRSVRDVAVADDTCPPDRIRVLRGGSGNGVEADRRFNPASYDAAHRRALRARYGIPDDALVVGFVGRLVREKGIVELAEAWMRVRAVHGTARLLVVGPLEPQDPVPAATMALLQGDPSVHLVGAAEAAPFFSAMDLLVLPTYREGFPNVLLEAAAMQLPVVATNVPGCLDAVAANTGTLVPPRDTIALADAITRYLGNPALRVAHGLAGRARVLGEFRQTDVWAALHGVYLERSTASATD